MSLLNTTKAPMGKERIIIPKTIEIKAV